MSRLSDQTQQELQLRGFVAVKQSRIKTLTAIVQHPVWLDEFDDGRDQIRAQDYCGHPARDLRRPPP